MNLKERLLPAYFESKEVHLKLRIKKNRRIKSEKTNLFIYINKLIQKLSLGNRNSIFEIFLLKNCLNCQPFDTNRS